MMSDGHELPISFPKKIENVDILEYLFITRDEYEANRRYFEADWINEYISEIQI